MKKLVYLFLSLMAAGGLFQACDNSKTYAEQLEDEKREVSRFIRDNGIHIISQDEFESMMDKYLKNHGRVAFG